MNRITEELIEKYVGFPDTLDTDVRDRVAEAIRVDAVARKVAEFYREYYRRLRGSDEGDFGGDPHDGGPDRGGPSGDGEPAPDDEEGERPSLIAPHQNGVSRNGRHVSVRPRTSPVRNEVIA